MKRYHIYKLGLAILFYAVYFRKQIMVNGLSAYQKMGGELPDELVFYQGVQGRPGIDFPVFARIPRTTFSCKEVESGYYADLETDCQVFHICTDGAKISFLCPNGTIFQQRDLICEWWFKVNCTHSPNLYEESAEQLREDSVRRKHFRKVTKLTDEPDTNVITTRRKPTYISDKPQQPHSTRKPIRNKPDRRTTNTEPPRGAHVNDEIRNRQISGNRGGRRYNQVGVTAFSGSYNDNRVSKEPSSSEETQIPQETASFYKNGQNSIRNVNKDSKDNPHPNHRETYSEIQQPKFYYSKPPGVETSSPVSPQTFSTNIVPLNNGKPFVASTNPSDIETSSPSSARTSSNSVSQTSNGETTTSRTFGSNEGSFVVTTQKSKPSYVETSSPVSPQIFSSTNRIPLNDGKPFVVTPPRSPYNVKVTNEDIEIARRTTERFVYSPTVPPITVTNRHVTEITTEQPKIIVDSDIPFETDHTESSFDRTDENFISTIPGRNTDLDSDQKESFKNTGHATNIDQNRSTDQYSHDVNYSTSPIHDEGKFGTQTSDNINGQIDFGISNVSGHSQYDNLPLENSGSSPVNHTNQNNPHSQASLVPTSVSFTTQDDLRKPNELPQNHDQSNERTTLVFGTKQTDETGSKITLNRGAILNQLDTNQNNMHSQGSLASTSVSFTTEDDLQKSNELPQNLDQSNQRTTLVFGSKQTDETGRKITLDRGTTLNQLDVTPKYNNQFSLSSVPGITKSPTDNKTSISLQKHEIVIGRPKIVSDDISDIIFSSKQPPQSNFGEKQNNRDTPLLDHQIVIGHPKIVPDDVSHKYATGSTTESSIIKIKVSNVPIPQNDHVSKSYTEDFNNSPSTTESNVFRISASGRSISFDGAAKSNANQIGAVTPKATGFYVTKEFNSNTETATTAFSSANTYLPKHPSPLPNGAQSANIARADVNLPSENVETATASKPTEFVNPNTYLPKSTTVKSTSVDSISNESLFNGKVSGTPSVVISSANTYLPRVTTPVPLLAAEISEDGIQGNLEPNRKPNGKTSAGVAEVPNSAFRSEVNSHPKPFELPPKPDNLESKSSPVNSEISSANTHAPIPNYKVSSARPFEAQPLDKVEAQTHAPTPPTPHTTEPSIYDHVHNMINTLKEIVNEQNGGEIDVPEDTPRPGLVIPPSAGPQTLLTLARYFENALNNVETEEEENEPISDEKQAISEILTRMTLNQYHELFKSNHPVSEETTTTFTTETDEGSHESSNDLEGQHTKNPGQTPRVRQLAKVFSQALSSYLDDPDTFRKALQDVRPTEPAAVSTSAHDNVEEDELLNYSDADIRPEIPRLTTTPSPSPTWGYLLAVNGSQTNSLDYNGLSSDGENLQSADSQSFVSHFNDIASRAQREGVSLTTPTSFNEVSYNDKSLPNDHWTASPGVAKLWKDALYTNPRTINEKLDFESEGRLNTSAPQPAQGEITYELRSLPKLELNSTQVHGILIDFMNSSQVEDGNKLQRLLQKLNTTQDEFLAKMRAIEQNPLTRRLILLLISECGSNITKEVETRATTVEEVINLAKENNDGFHISETKDIYSVPAEQVKHLSNPSPFKIYVDPDLEDEDTRALHLLNSLYSIASKFGK